MSTLATPLFFREEEPNEDARLLKLFQNRVELKKEFEKLRTELERLADQLSQQESATLKAQQKLEQIEGLLADPESAANSIVFYQLRNVWQHCRHRLRGFVAELSTTRKQREYRQQIAGFDQQRDTDLARIEARLAELDAGGERLAADIQTVQADRKGFFNFFRRRRLKPELQSLKSSLEAVEFTTLAAEYWDIAGLVPVHGPMPGNEGDHMTGPASGSCGDAPNMAKRRAPGILLMSSSIR